MFFIWPNRKEGEEEHPKLHFYRVKPLCFPMDFPIHIDTISMGLSIMYLMALQVKFSKLGCISVPEGFLILANSADSDEIQHYAAFHLVLHCLQQYPFRDI